jgi:hypothetical protein
LRIGLPTATEKEQKMGKHYRPLSLREEDFFRLAPPAGKKQSGLWPSLKHFLRKTRDFRSDAIISEEVSEHLANHPAIDSQEIEVAVKRGVVTLSGQVRDRWSKRAAEWAVERIRGVRDVQNQLEVQGWRDRHKRSA